MIAMVAWCELFFLGLRKVTCCCSLQVGPKLAPGNSRDTSRPNTKAEPLCESMLHGRRRRRRRLLLLLLLLLLLCCVCTVHICSHFCRLWYPNPLSLESGTSSILCMSHRPILSRGQGIGLWESGREARM